MMEKAQKAWPIDAVAPAEVQRQLSLDCGPWFGPGRFACFLLLGILGTFPNVVFGPDTFFFRDYGCFGYPLAHFARESFWHGELPLWNPLNNCGLPFLGQWNTMTLYPPMLFCHVFPLAWALGVFNLAHLFLAGMGMYRLVLEWTKSPQAGTLSGVVFAFNGLTLNCLMWPNNIAALGWMPWVILWVSRALRSGGRTTLQAALVSTFQMLAGAPEITMFTWAVCAGLGMLQWWRVKRGMVVGRFAFVVLLVAGLSAIQLLPFLELLHHSQRDSAFGTAQWSMPLSGWINFFVPLYGFKPAYQGVYAQMGQFWTSSYFVGLLVVGLAAMALRFAQSRRVYFFWAVVAASLLMAWGDNAILYAWLRKMAPQIGIMRYPIKFIVPAVFGLSVLAGYGIVVVVSAKFEIAKIRKAAAVAGGLLFLAAAGAFTDAWLRPGEGTDFPAMARAMAIQAALTIVALGAMAIYRRSEAAPRRALSWGALLVAVMVSLLTHCPPQNPSVNQSAYEAGAVDAFLPWTARQSHARAMASPEARQQLRFSVLEDPLQHMLSRRAALFNNCNLLDGVAKVDGFYSLYPREMAEITAAVYARSNTPSAGVLDLLAVSHVNSGNKLFDWEVRKDFLPMVFCPRNVREVKAEESLPGVLSDGFDPRETLLLSGAAPGQAGPQPRALVKQVQRMGAELAFEVTAEQPTWVGVSQTWYPHWKAFANGVQLELRRANHAFQAVRVPAGTTQVRLVYDDWNFRAGASISMSCLLASIGFWARGRSILAKPAGIQKSAS